MKIGQRLGTRLNIHTSRDYVHKDKAGGYTHVLVHVRTYTAIDYTVYQEYMMTA